MHRLKKWAELNNLKHNTDKSKEMLIPKSGRWAVPEPPPLGMERVSQLKILGVLFTNDLSVTSHVDDIISKCASSTYALRILKGHGLQGNGKSLRYATRQLSAVSYMLPRHGEFAPVLRTGNESTDFFVNYIGRDIKVNIDELIKSAEEKLLCKV